MVGILLTLNMQTFLQELAVVQVFLKTHRAVIQMNLFDEHQKRLVLLELLGMVMDSRLPVQADIMLRQGHLAESTILQSAVAAGEVLMEVHRLVLAQRNGGARGQVARGLNMAAAFVLGELVRDDAREVGLILQKVALQV